MYGGVASDLCAAFGWFSEPEKLHHACNYLVLVAQSLCGLRLRWIAHLLVIEYATLSYVSNQCLNMSLYVASFTRLSPAAKNKGEYKVGYLDEKCAVSVFLRLNPLWLLPIG